MSPTTSTLLLVFGVDFAIQLAGWSLAALLQTEKVWKYPVSSWNPPLSHEHAST